MNNTTNTITSRMMTKSSWQDKLERKHTVKYHTLEKTGTWPESKQGQTKYKFIRLAFLTASTQQSDKDNTIGKFEPSDAERVSHGRRSKTCKVNGNPRTNDKKVVTETVLVF